MLSTVILLVTYVGVAFALVAYAGTDFLTENAEEEEFIFGLLATDILGGWDWIVLLAVTTSAIASTQTTIIPASRTGAVDGAAAGDPRRLRSRPPALPHP